MSPSPACAPRRRGAPRRLRSREAPIRENGGTFLPTTRPDDLDSPTGATACHEPPSDKGAPSDRTPAFPDRSPGRGVSARPRTGPAPQGWPGMTDGGRPAKHPKRTGRQVLMRTAWPPISITRATRAETRRTQRPTPDSPPWEGPQPSADSQPRRHPAKRSCLGTRPDAFAYWWKSDPNPSSQQPARGPRSADSCAWIPERRTIHRPLIHGIVHRNCPRGSYVDLIPPGDYILGRGSLRCSDVWDRIQGRRTPQHRTRR
jgi:hypothetical protein